MIRVLFVCHGNICRSPMAEFMFKDMVKKNGLEAEFYIESAAASSEEIGNPVYPPAKKRLAKEGIDCSGKRAVKMKKEDYSRFDYILAMEKNNIDRILRITGGDPEEKIHLLLDFTERKGEISDPWYTGDFDTAYDDIMEGLKGFLAFVKGEKR